MARPSTNILSPQIIARAALRLVAEHGGFTIPGVAAALGVHPSSLYHHLPGGRRAIVHRMRQELYAAITLEPLRDPSVPALERLASWMHAYRTATAQVPAVVPLLVGMPVQDGRTLEIYEALFEILRDAGVPATMRVPVSAMVDAVVLGSAVDAAAPAPLWQIGDHDLPELAALGARDDETRALRGFELAVDAVVDAVRAAAEPAVGEGTPSSAPG